VSTEISHLGSQTSVCPPATRISTPPRIHESHKQILAGPRLHSSPDIVIRHSPDELTTLCVFGKIVDSNLHLDCGESASIEPHRRLGEWLEMIGPNSPSKDNKYRNGDTWRAALYFTILHSSFTRDRARSCAFCPPSGQVQRCTRRTGAYAHHAFST
jgi:hypothetical protein